MIKRVSIPFFIAALLSTFLAVPALAANKSPSHEGHDPRSRKRRLLHGEIISVDLSANTFGLQIRHGETIIIQVDENTKFRGEISDLEGMDIGSRALAGVMAQEGDLPLAIFVAVSEQLGRINRHGGRISAIDLEQSKFQLETRGGDNLEFQVTDQTRFKGAVSELADLELDMMAGIGSITEDDGSERALLVIAAHRPRVKRSAGTLTNVDLAEQTFSLITNAGEEKTFFTDARTRYRSRNGQIQRLEDLAPEMFAGVAFVEQADGSLLAKVVIAGDPSAFDLDLRAMGKVLSTGPDQFTIETAEGTRLTVLTTLETKFHSQGGAIQGPDDMEPGMGVWIGAQALESGEYEAAVVFVRMRASR